MRKYIHTFILTILLVIPVHFSSTSEYKLTDSEKKKLQNSIEEKIIHDKLLFEYEEFYKNLNNVKSTEQVISFINTLMCDAIESKSLPSIVIAQAALETGYGKYNKLENNLFGIKGIGIRTKTKEFYNNKFVTITAEFQHFTTVGEAINIHGNILKRYGVFGYDYSIWIDKLVECGYATDPDYDTKLNKIINKYQLYRLDRIKKYQEQIANIGIENCNQTPNLTYNILKNI